jgi:hypothetical protein
MGVACSTHEYKINAQRVVVGKPEENKRQEDLDVGGKIISRWKVEK